MTAIAVFRSYVADEHREEHDRLYNQMHALVQQCPGYISHKLFAADDGETVVIAEFTDVDAVETWGEQADHKIAQAAGKERVYRSYDVAVCEVVERHVKPEGNSGA